MYRALAHQCETKGAQALIDGLSPLQAHSALREKAAAHIERHRAAFEPFVVNVDAPEGAEAQLAAFCAGVRGVEWGTQVELQALAAELRVYIEVRHPRAACRLGVARCAMCERRSCGVRVGEHQGHVRCVCRCSARGIRSSSSGRSLRGPARRCCKCAISSTRTAVGSTTTAWGPRRSRAMLERGSVAGRLPVVAWDRQLQHRNYAAAASSSTSGAPAPASGTARMFATGVCVWTEYSGAASVNAAAAACHVPDHVHNAPVRTRPAATDVNNSPALYLRRDGVGACLRAPRSPPEAMRMHAFPPTASCRTMLLASP